jgi:hypothetical protein
LWSGSALAGQTSKGNPYSGVGLELYANTSSYFRYSTSDNEIEVVTDKFFFGNPSSSFISGSNGLIEISSSNFILTAEGDVTASSFIAVQDGNTLFDTNNEFVDGNNIGRIVYFDKDETNIDLSTIGGSSNAATASVFQTYILPGETRCQMSCTYEINNTTGTSATIVAQGYISSASLGPTTGASSYGLFENGAAMNSSTTPIGTVPAGTIESGAVNKELVSGNNFANRQGMYVQIHLIVYTTAAGKTGTLKLKNFVFRTSRVVGGSITTPSNPIG